MDIVCNNPYRVLGLLAGASTREVTRQTTNLKRYIAADAELPKDYSFAALDSFRRTADDIDAATSRLNLDDDKMLAALFWFWKGNDITDEPAFDALKDGDVNMAKQIWKRQIIGTKEDGGRFWKSVTARNFSAYHNYSIINMLMKDGRINTAVAANIYFIESDYFAEFVKATVDVTYKVSKRDIELKFLETIMSDNISISQLVQYLKGLDFAAKQDFMKSVSQKFMANINAQIETARRVRTTNKQQAATAGETLYKNTKDDLAQLKSIFGATDFSYSNVADKVANEILQCGIEYFNHHKDSSLDPGARTMSVFKMAKILVVGNATKGRCDENIKVVQQWIDCKPERDREKLIVEDMKFLADKLKSKVVYSSTYSSKIVEIKNFIVSCKQKLDNIGTVLGTTDELYLNVSSAVVNKAQGLLVKVVNDAQEDYNNYNMKHSFF